MTSPLAFLQNVLWRLGLWGQHDSGARQHVDLWPIDRVEASWIVVWLNSTDHFDVHWVRPAATTTAADSAASTGHLAVWWWSAAATTYDVNVWSTSQHSGSSWNITVWWDDPVSDDTWDIFVWWYDPATSTSRYWDFIVRWNDTPTPKYDRDVVVWRCTTTTTTAATASGNNWDVFVRHNAATAVSAHGRNIAVR